MTKQFGKFQQININSAGSITRKTRS